MATPNSFLQKDSLPPTAERRCEAKEADSYAYYMGLIGESSTNGGRW